MKPDPYRKRLRELGHGHEHVHFQKSPSCRTRSFVVAWSETSAELRCSCGYVGHPADFVKIPLAERWARWGEQHPARVTFTSS